MAENLFQSMDLQSSESFLMEMLHIQPQREHAGEVCLQCQQKTTPLES